MSDPVDAAEERMKELSSGFVKGLEKFDRWDKSNHQSGAYTKTVDDGLDIPAFLDRRVKKPKKINVDDDL